MQDKSSDYPKNLSATDILKFTSSGSQPEGHKNIFKSARMKIAELKATPTWHEKFVVSLKKTAIKLLDVLVLYNESEVFFSSINSITAFWVLSSNSHKNK